MMIKDEMLEQYEVLGFAYGWAIVRRKSDGVEGTLDYYATTDYDGNIVRYYHNFVEA